MKFEEINLKFKKDDNKVQKSSDPHSVTNVTGRHSVFSTLLGADCQPKVGILDIYLVMFMVCLSVSLSVVGHADVLWQNGWTDRDAVWHVGWGGPQ